jgi:hypothetical protein
MADKGRLSVEQLIKAVLFFTETRTIKIKGCKCLLDEFQLLVIKGNKRIPN